ncbi:MAG: hypothetical protein R3B97_05395 [Dehalococcoidia bacterium]
MIFRFRRRSSPRWSGRRHELSHGGRLAKLRPRYLHGNASGTLAVGERLKNVLKTGRRESLIFTPNRLLEYDTPAERIGKGQFRDVLALIEALAEGVVL